MNRRQFIVASAALLTGCGDRWNGFRYFIAGQGVPLVVAPVGPKGLGQWIGQSTIDAFVKAGFLVTGVHWSGMNGGDEDYGARHRLIGSWLHFMDFRDPVCFAQSRGGLQLLNFACNEPAAFRRITALYPVTDPLVYPGDTAKLRAAYGAERWECPNDKAAALRGRRIHIWHGDSDKLVPKERTTDVFAIRSGAEVTTLKGVGHVPYFTPAMSAYLHDDA